MDWNEAGGFNKIPLWKFVLENIKVSYSIKQKFIGWKINVEIDRRILHVKEENIIKGKEE